MPATPLLLDNHERYGVIPTVADADVALRPGLAEALRLPKKVERGSVPRLSGHFDVGQQPFCVFFTDTEGDTGGSFGGVAAGQVRSWIATSETIATLGLREEGTRGGRRFVEPRHEDSDAHRCMVDAREAAIKS